MSDFYSFSISTPPTTVQSHQRPCASCRKTVQNIKDMVDISKPRKPKPKPLLEKHPSSKYPTTTKPELEPNPRATMNRSRSSTTAITTNAKSTRPVIELPEGHPSRSVVEIIFRISWGPKPFPGRIEMIFKIQNGTRVVSRFEEFRVAVKGRAAAASPEEGSNREENAQCVADGNEVMRFHCLGATAEGGGSYDGAAGGAWLFPDSKGSAICTFSSSGEAHENAGGSRGGRSGNNLVWRVYGMMVG